MVTARQLKRLKVALRLGTWCCAILTLFVAWRMWQGSNAQPATALAVDGRPEEGTDETRITQSDDLRDLNWYAPIWQRDLRQDPIPPPPAVAQPKAKQLVG